MEERNHLLPKNTNYVLNNSSDEDWSEDGSSYSSYYSDSDSSVPEWEPLIDENTGQLLYINCHPFVTQNAESNRPKEPPTSLPKDKTRRSTRSKFLRLIRRRESKRRSKRGQKTLENPEGMTNKVKFQDFQEGEEKDVTLKVEFSNPYKLGRKASLIETILGFSVSTLSDGSRLMIAGFPPDSKARYDKNIKIGDWLKSINNQLVTNENLVGVLEHVQDKSEVLLKLQRVAGVEVTKDPPLNELNHQSNFVKYLIRNETSNEVVEILNTLPVGLIYLNMNNLSENGPEFEDVEYCFPAPFQKNVLCGSRGMYVTINHLITDLTKSSPEVTTVLFKNRLAHISYTRIDDNKLLLLMIPDDCLSSRELIQVSLEINRTLIFTYGSIDEALTVNGDKSEINGFLMKYFIRILSHRWSTDQEFLATQRTNVEMKRSELGDIFGAAQFVGLPSEIKMQIEDALIDLEACDYREWNEEPLDCQRLFTIIGSAYYHAGYLLCSHFTSEDLLDVHSYCKQNGFFHLSVTEPLKSLIHWREVYPSSCRESLTAVEVPEGKRYLLVVGVGKDLLACIMESGGCTELPELNTSPDAFYVEEVQATLAHIQELRLSEFIEKWLTQYVTHQISIPEAPNSKKRATLGFLRSNLTNSKSVENLKKQPEVTSILKRRGSEQGLTVALQALSVLDEGSEARSEDSGSQGGYSERSEATDEPIIGRKAQRERHIRRDSDDSETDDYEESSQMSGSSFDMSELRQPQIPDLDNTKPAQLTTGNENVLFYYVDLDLSEGVLMCPPLDNLQSKTMELILDNFRNCANSIHDLFQNTIRFRSMSAQDMAKCVLNKSLVAIKEHGVLFECPFLEDKEISKKHRITYWVIGRLFYLQSPREVYVCYQDSIPQNIIELAFKMALQRIM